MSFLLQAFALGMESYILTLHLPQHKGDDRLLVLKANKNRHSIDPQTLEEAITLARTTDGSSNHTMEVKLGMTDIDLRISHTMAYLHREKVLKACAGKRMTSWQWDPGCYSKSSWNIGMLANTEPGSDGLAADMCPKATASSPSP